ncbi:MAG: TetR/AcrR family transcriptional regulator [Nevskia sp.]|nr:TetR/AcrR family transcriptional regulator [Nevskia sp.]
MGIHQVCLRGCIHELLHDLRSIVRGIRTALLYCEHLFAFNSHPMRKKPQQLRSRLMVDALIEATACAIGKHGLADTTTHHIAREAGVSVGSLYQYFDSREALLEALIGKLSRDVAELVEVRLAELIEQDLRALFKGLLTGILDLLRKDQGYLALARHWHELRTLAAVDAVEKNFLEAFRMYLFQHHVEYRFSGLPATLFIVYNSTVFTSMRYLSQPHPPFQIEQLVDGLTDMIVGYLEQSRIAERGGRRKRNIGAGSAAAANRGKSA